MTNVHRRFSVFLTPAAEDRDWCEKEISKLAACYNVPAFEPHVTIYSGPCADEAELETIRRTLGEIAAKTAPITLKIGSLDVSDQLFKSLFISFEENPSLRHIHQRLKNANDQADGYELIPHLSLLYADIPLDERRGPKTS